MASIRFLVWRQQSQQIRLQMLQLVDASPQCLDTAGIFHFTQGVR